MLAGYDILLKPQSFALQGVAVFLFFTVSAFGRCLVVVAVISAFLRPCPPLFKPCQCPHSGRGRADDVGSAHHAAPMTSVRPLASTTRSGWAAGGCIRHEVSQTDRIGGAGDGVN